MTLGRTLTVTDDAYQATVSVRIEQARNGDPIVTDIRFTATGDDGLSQAALGMLSDLGLSMPAAPTAPAPRQRKPVKAPPKKTPPKPAAARKPAAQRKPATAASEDQLHALRGAPAPALPAPEPAAETPPAPPPTPEPEPEQPAAAVASPRRTYRRGQPPHVDVLRAAFLQHEGRLNDIADHFGAATSTVSNWLRNARSAGHRIALEPAGS